MNKYIILILGMSIVTIIPRILPLIFYNLRLPYVLETWIKGIPYAALAALTIPGVFKLDQTKTYIGIVGFFVALISSLLKLPIYITVFASIISVYACYLIF